MLQAMMLLHKKVKKKYVIRRRRRRRAFRCGGAVGGDRNSPGRRVRKKKELFKFDGVVLQVWSLK